MAVRKSRSSTEKPPKSQKSVAGLLSEAFPTLREYWPNLQTCSAKQALFLLSSNSEVFFGGAAGPGKSDALLAGALQYVDVPGYKALILRRTYAELALPSAIMSRAREWLYGRVRWNDKTYTFTFPSGATITFGYMESDRDVYRYQGTEAQYIAFDELTQFSEEQYTYMFRSLRATSDVPVPLRMRSASNPGGVGHTWVKQRFIMNRENFIPSTLADHPDKKYREDYAQKLGQMSELRRKQYLDGDWDASEGMAYSLDPASHFVKPFDLPQHWDRFESMDYGTTAPTSWLLYAVDTDGNIIVSDLYYKPNTLPDEDAAEILKRRAAWWEKRDEKNWPVRHPCYGDPVSIRERLAAKNDFGQPMTLQDLYQEHGIYILPANNRRMVGHVMIRRLLKPDPQRRFPLWHEKAGEWGSPRLFFMRDRCQELVTQLQDAPLESSETVENGEAVSKIWEGRYGHAHASLRYGVTTWHNPSDMPPEPEPQTEDEIRAAYMKRLQTHMRDKKRPEDAEVMYW